MENRRTHSTGRARWFLAAGLWAAIFAACGGGGGGPSCGSPPSIAGPWAGVLNDSDAGGGNLAIDFDQSGCSVGGSWQTSFPDTSFDGSGTITGSADGTAVTISLLTQAPGSCNYKVTGTLRDSSEIAGSYSTFGTSCARSGTFDVLSQATPTPESTATPSPTPTPTP